MLGRQFKKCIKNTLLIGLTLFATVNFGAEGFQATALTDNIYLIAGPAGNTLVAADEDGLILVDGVPASYAEDYLDFVYALTGTESVKSLIISHWHPEVTGLNSLLGPDDVEIIAHENTRQWLATTIRERGETILHTPLPDNQLPDRTFYWGTMGLPFRTGSLEIGYLLQSHTDGDIYVLFKDQNILFTGPAVREDGWATVDETTNGFIGGITDAYDTLGKLVDEQTVIIPGNGEPLSALEFNALESMYKSLKAEMVSLLRQSLGPQEVVLANPAQGLKPEWGDPSDFLDEGFRSFYGHLRNGRQIGGGFP